MDNYDVARATREIKDFINDFSVWYLRRSRDRFKKGDKQGIKVFGFVLFELSKIMAPITPFIAEHIYQRIGAKKESVHLDNYPKFDKKLIDKKLEEKMDTVREIVTQALAQRAKAGIKTRQPLALLRIKNYDGRCEAADSPEGCLRIKNNDGLLELIKDEVNVKEIVFDAKVKTDVEIDTKITSELRQEGIVREVIRQIQGMRKKAGYKPKHRILVRYSGTKQLNAILVKNKDFIVKELRADDFLCGDRPKRVFNIEREIEIDNQKLWLGIRKI
jgi:isoleucyl-tRNA synthetase